MEQELDRIIGKMIDPLENEAFRFSDQLAAKNSEYVLDKMVELLHSDNYDIQHLAARTLSKMENNEKALEPLFEVINDEKNKKSNGGLVEALSGFDCSQHFVDIFKIYLFGNFKASAMAKEILDYEEFDITPRVIKKAEKHWNHFTHNTKQDEGFDRKKEEVETMLNELRELFQE